MSGLTNYLLGQVLHKQDSTQSALRETSDKIDKLSADVREAISWGQRLVLLGLTWAAAMGLNFDPDKLGSALASFLRGGR